MKIGRNLVSTAKSISIAVLISGVAAAGCATTGGKPMDQASLRREIARGNSEWIEAFRAGDAKRLANIFDPSGAMLSEGGKFSRGRNDIHDAIAGTMSRFGPTETTIETDDVWLIDDIAYETGRYSYTFTPKDGKEKVLKGRYVVRWKRQPDDTWKIDMDMGLSD